MAKNICSCINNNYLPGTSSFYSFKRFNNKYAPVNTNPKIHTLLAGQAGQLNTNRIDNNDCATPYRVPFNHCRKSYSCKTDCLTNEKIIKDTDSNVEMDELHGGDPECYAFACRRKNYASTRLVNRVGVRNHNYGSNYRNYLQFTGKLYEQNAAGLLPENRVPNTMNDYKIGSVNGTTYNINSGTVDNSQCKISYKMAISTTDVSYMYAKIPTATKKYTNPSKAAFSSVSSRGRLQQLKYNTILAGQQTKGGYNNCINGQLCSKYEAPGPNTKSIMGLSRIQRCIPSRINGMKQKCS